MSGTDRGAASMKKKPTSGSSSLMSLFEPPATPPPNTAGKSLPEKTAKEDAQPLDLSRGSTVVCSNKMGQATASLISDSFTTTVDNLLGTPPTSKADDSQHRRSTLVRSNQSVGSTEREPMPKDSLLGGRLLPPQQRTSSPDDAGSTERTPLLKDSSLEGLFHPPPAVSSTDETPKTGTGNRKTMPSATVETRNYHKLTASNLPSIEEIEGAANSEQETAQLFRHRFQSALKYCCSECSKPTTWIGSFMFMLFQVVFSLTMGAAITRPHGGSMLGLMTKMAALGIMFGAPVYWINLGRDIPALYPTVDLFSAPFLANIAAIIDQELYHDPNVSNAGPENDQIFLASFTTLACISLFISGTMLVLASIFKLANLGAFLPFPVLCGFFAAVGVLTWTLAFKVDTNGKSVNAVFFSGDWDLICRSLIHHAPSVIVAVAMKYLGPKNPFYVVGLVFGTIGLFYATMFAFGISMEDMIEREWFWSNKDLVYEQVDATIGFAIWAPPAPFGWVNSLSKGMVHWTAVSKAFETTVALSFLYLIRCSLHGAAMKKNVPNLCRVERESPGTLGPLRGLTRDVSARLSIAAHRHRRKFSEVIDIEQIVPQSSNSETGVTIVHAKPTNASLKDILLQYGFSQYICGAVGSFAVTPCVAASPTMYTLGAENVAPQLGSVVLLSVFYLTDFRLVGFIPKPAFSSLLVLAFIDMISTWFIKSYIKTKEKAEWLVVPLIVILAFVVGLLGAVIIGLAMSTFLFVASFFRSGVVKYVANGLNIRSTIERPQNAARWLDQNGDLIQILILQNYLFFGNASSILSYITSMFEDPLDNVDQSFLPPFPKIVVLDLTLVTGIDTSAVDAFSDILAQCGNHECKLFLSGVSSSLRQVMYLGGVKPEATRDRTRRKLRFFPTLDAAIGKAEDMLLIEAGVLEEQIVHSGTEGSGFERALHHIDEQHATHFSEDLINLEQYTTVIELEPSEILYEEQPLERGLFFIEHGVMKIERNADFTLTRARSSEALRRLSMNDGTLNALHARTGSIGRELARMKADGAIRKGAPATQRFRVARMGPGWVLGSIEAISGAVHPGTTVAVSHCRLHYISYKKIEELEEKEPLLVLKLYKLLSYLMARRQELTIGQLATLHSIMSSPAQKKPIGRGSSSSFMG